MSQEFNHLLYRSLIKTWQTISPDESMTMPFNDGIHLLLDCSFLEMYGRPSSTLKEHWDSFISTFRTLPYEEQVYKAKQALSGFTFSY